MRKFLKDLGRDWLKRGLWGGLIIFVGLIVNIADSLPAHNIVLAAQPWQIAIVSFGVWILLASLIRRWLPQERHRYLEYSLVAFTIVLIAVPLQIRERWLLDSYRWREQLRANSRQQQLDRAISRAFAPFDENSEIRDHYMNRVHQYTDVRVDFYHLGNAGVSNHFLAGQLAPAATLGSEVHLPFASNVELPYEAGRGLRRYVRIVSLDPDDPAKLRQRIEPKVEEHPTGSGAFFYDVSFATPDETPFLIVRRFFHPSSQTGNPDAFLAFLDLIERPITGSVEINLYTDFPIALAQLWAYPSTNTGERHAADIPHTMTEIPSGDFPERLPPGVRVSGVDDGGSLIKDGVHVIKGGYRFVLGNTPRNERLAVVYFGMRTPFEDEPVGPRLPLTPNRPGT